MTPINDKQHDSSHLLSHPGMAGTIDSGNDPIVAMNAFIHPTGRSHPMRIPARHAPVVTSFFMALFMSFIMSALLLAVNVGWVSDFLSHWLLHAFPVAFIAAFPTVLLVRPLVLYLTTKVTTTS